MMFSLSFVGGGGSKSAEGGPNPLADLDRGSPYPLMDLDGGSPYPPADLDQGVQIAGTPALVNA